MTDVKSHHDDITQSFFHSFSCDSYSKGDVLGLALDIDNKLMSLAVNGIVETKMSAENIANHAHGNNHDHMMNAMHMYYLFQNEC
jgi:hypothetical protein